jgi:hypothetical protein
MTETIPVELEDDDVAWGEAIVLCGEMLRDVDGKMPPKTTWDLTVCEGTRTVASITLMATRYKD